jgi:hypothetical protein
LSHASFSLAAVFIGFGLFRAVRCFRPLGRLTVVLLVSGFVLVVAPYVGRFVLADICLDEGGRWSNQTIQCDK